MDNPPADESGTGTVKYGTDQPLVDPDPNPRDFLPVEDVPKIILHPSPEYPPLALRAGLEGNVYVKALVDKDGSVKRAFLLKADNEIFAQAALDAALKWTFTPALMNGKPVKVWVSIPFRFRLIH